MAGFDPSIEVGRALDALRSAHGPTAHGPRRPAVGSPSQPPRADPRQARRTGRRERPLRPARPRIRTCAPESVNEGCTTGRRMARPPDGQPLCQHRCRRGWSRGGLLQVAQVHVSRLRAIRPLGALPFGGREPPPRLPPGPSLRHFDEARVVNFSFRAEDA